MSGSRKGKYVDVLLDSTFPAGWKKQVYKVNGKLHPKWSIWRDPSGNKYFKEAAVMAKLAKLASKPPALQDISLKKTQEDNLAKEKELVCHLCGKTFYQRNNVKRHLENVHSIFTETVNTSASKPPREKENKPKTKTSTNVIDPPKPKLPLRVLNKRNSKGIKISRSKEKKSKKKAVQKLKETVSMEELETTAYCDLCGRGFKGRCGQSNMERHRRNHHGNLANKTCVGEQTEEEISELDIVTDFYNKIILKLL